MNYELALKLKEAGFPWRDGRCSYCIECNFTYCSVCRDEAEYEPTLSELIKACGEEFGGIIRRNNKFGCGSPNEVISEAQFVYNTPEEAVANLWLELNK